MSTFRATKAAVLVVASVAAWIFTALLGFMCIFSVVLGPLSVGVFIVTAAVGSLAFQLTVAAADSVIDLWHPSLYSDRNQS